MRISFNVGMKGLLYFMKTVLIIVGFVLIMTIALFITCMISFGAQFNKWETKIEIEYRGLQPFLQKRQQLLQQLFGLLVNTSDVTAIKDEISNTSSVLDAIQEEKDWVTIIQQNAAIINDLSSIYKWIKESEKALDSDVKSIVEQLNRLEEDVVEHSEAYNKAVRTFNVLITMAPANVIAKLQKKVAAPTLTIPGHLF